MFASVQKSCSQTATFLPSPVAGRAFPKGGYAWATSRRWSTATGTLFQARRAPLRRSSCLGSSTPNRLPGLSSATMYIVCRSLSYRRCSVRHFPRPFLQRTPHIDGADVQLVQDRGYGGSGAALVGPHELEQRFPLELLARVAQLPLPGRGQQLQRSVEARFRQQDPGQFIAV
jgi:hypothetical protein